MRLRLRCRSFPVRGVRLGHLIRASADFFKMLIKMWRQEWRTEGFTLRYHTPENFTRCHWQKTERVLPMWIVYRTFLFLYFTFSLMYSLLPIGRAIPKESTTKYLIFLTHWTYIVELFQFFLAFIIVMIKATKECKSSEPVEPMEKMPWYYQMYWVFFNIALPSALVVSIVFWATVYDEKYYPADAANFIMHVFNSVFMLIDFWLVAQPVKFLHFYFPGFYALVYVMFSIIYYVCGGTGVKGLIPIYGILDWRKPGPTILSCTLCFLFLLFLHFLFCCLSLFKFWVKNRSSPPERQ